MVVQQWMEQDSYGLINMQFICSDNLRHRMNTNEDGEWNKELDCPEGFNQAIGREQGGYGLVNVAVAFTTFLLTVTLVSRPSCNLICTDLQQPSAY